MTEHEKLGNNICSLEQLENYADLSANKEQLAQVVQAHPMCVSPYYMSLINWKDPRDPIRRMALPSSEELNLEGFYDTSGEAENTKMPSAQIR
jgi:L-lysine 2,3-aminomutase